MNRSSWIEAFSGFAASLPEALLLLDQRASVIEANGSAARLFGVPTADLVDRSLRDLVCSSEERVSRYWRQCSTSREPTPGILEVPSQDGGQPRRIRCDGGIYRPPHRSQDGALVVLRLRAKQVAISQFSALEDRLDRLNEEIQQRRNAERELERLLEAEHEARLAAAEANRLKDEFLASLSHELRTPLNVILGWVDILQEQGTEPDLVERALPAMKKAVREETELVEDLLDVQRIVTGRLRLEVEDVDVGALATDVAGGFRGAAEAKGVRLTVETESDLPAIEADRSRIRQIVWNLVSNAVKFTSAGDEVRVRVSCRDGLLQLVVSDTGPGIEPEVLPFIFDRFRQAGDFPRESHGGVGLGLAIVRHLAELHGGSAAAASDGPGEGASFTVSLPVRHAGRLTNDATLAEPDDDHSAEPDPASGRNS